MNLNTVAVYICLRYSRLALKPLHNLLQAELTHVRHVHSASTNVFLFSAANNKRREAYVFGSAAAARELKFLEFQRQTGATAAGLFHVIKPGVSVVIFCTYYPAVDGVQ